MHSYFIKTYVEFDKFVCNVVVSKTVLPWWSEDQWADGTSVVVVSVENGRHIVSSFHAPKTPDA